MYLLPTIFYLLVISIFWSNSGIVLVFSLICVAAILGAIPYDLGRTVADTEHSYPYSVRLVNEINKVAIKPPEIRYYSEHGLWLAKSLKVLAFVGLFLAMISILFIHRS